MDGRRSLEKQRWLPSQTTRRIDGIGEQTQVRVYGISARKRAIAKPPAAVADRPLTAGVSASRYYHFVIASRRLTVALKVHPVGELLGRVRVSRIRYEHFRNLNNKSADASTVLPPPDLFRRWFSLRSERDLFNVTYRDFLPAYAKFKFLNRQTSFYSNKRSPIKFDTIYYEIENISFSIDVATDYKKKRSGGVDGGGKRGGS